MTDTPHLHALAMAPDKDLSARLARSTGTMQAAYLHGAYRSGQLITLADHEAAVAKSVEASEKALQDALAYIDKGHQGMARNIIAAAIRSRGVAG